ncbi:MAG TPA: hypothetical protein VJB57_19230 [Dehalococcoidia bacterium]|nr:hypothetical protein [Dehalococcoidia bacterium]
MRPTYCVRCGHPRLYHVSACKYGLGVARRCDCPGFVAEEDADGQPDPVAAAAERHPDRDMAGAEAGAVSKHEEERPGFGCGDAACADHPVRTAISDAGLARLARDVFEEGDVIPCRECGRRTVYPLTVCFRCYQSAVRQEAEP